jgi:hypothetical protein
MTSGDKLAVWFFAFIFGAIVYGGIADYHAKKLQLEELKIQKECVCK